MNTEPITALSLQRSVISVPPLARAADESLCREENAKIVRHLEAGGVSTLLYGGNAILYHLAPSEYPALLAMLAEIAGPDSLVIPSVGAAFGMMMDQAAMLQEHDFPTAMILPQPGVATSAGVATGVRRFVDRYGKPAVLYIKFDGYIDPADVQRLVDDGLVSFIKYATVRAETANDDYLRQLVERVDPQRIVSGIGEQPAITHLRDFGLAGFTSGCVCVAPRLSMNMLQAIQAGNFEEAERIRQIFSPLENLRNSIQPIRVLHAAVELAGIAVTGPVTPLLSAVDEADHPAIREAAKQLLEQDAAVKA
ncbi:dihydrodipicolinate synthase family protein [Lignipirellula cremea]|uniref:5-dehydro-4-deoxyglucarate dehydratase n=1 Tax=Lignipirellula cremea TaxID=2528010 RepID=A0A518DTX4_9BACT|nr:dihydrodipicolinate synthase family protein [Lignipirellula cremea]QDU95279.1 5-dehydro-4-deoxyglucarate dehydratase [Lignipirellula cremea]